MSKPSYTCPISGRVYKTKRGALNSEEREKKKEYIRLNSTSPNHFLNLFVEKCEEFWGWDVVIKEPYDVFNCRISDYFITMEASVSINFSKKIKEGSVSKILQSHINGVQFVNFTKRNLVTFILNLSEFPLMAEKTREYLEFNKSFREWSVKKSWVFNEGHEFSEERGDIIDMKNKIRALENQLRELKTTFSERTEYYSEGYSMLWESNNPEPSTDIRIKEEFYNMAITSVESSLWYLSHSI
ncbi:MAG: hypothetical protein GY920_11430 [Aliivibrio sp.]|nr:hypothetical protein [Aliivibrio sp.]